MKKLTLVSLVLFLALVGGIFAYPVLSPSSKGESANQVVAPPIVANVTDTPQSQGSIQQSTPKPPPTVVTKPPVPTPAQSNTTQNNTTTGGPQKFTTAEVAGHNRPNDCYLVINNNVYNVSTYIGSHPGGVRAITSRCGQEVTGIFARIHSNRAWDLLSAYKVGVLMSA